MSDHQTSLDGSLQSLTETTSFCGLPEDIRLLIYGYVFEPGAVLITLRPARKQSIVKRFANFNSAAVDQFIPCDFSIRNPFYDPDESPQRAPNLDVLYLSKTIRTEALPAFYANLVFSFYQPDLYECFMTALPAGHRQCIRHVALDFGLNWLFDHYSENGITCELRLPYESQIFRTSHWPERIYRVFTKDASNEEWYGQLLPPTLHSVEARMWNFLDINGLGLRTDLYCCLPFEVDADCAINGKVEELKELKNHLSGKDSVEEPKSLVQAGVKLSYELSKDWFLASSLPVPWGCSINMRETLNQTRVLSLGVICLNLSLKRTGRVEERIDHLGDASEVAFIMDEGPPEAILMELVDGAPLKRHRLTSWG